VDSGWGFNGFGSGFGVIIWPELAQKRGQKIVFSGAPGRGVLRFLRGGYRRPVHNLAKNAFFSLFCQI